MAGMSATNTKKQKAWTPLGVIGLFFILIFAAICIAPFFVYADYVLYAFYDTDDFVGRCEFYRFYKL